MSERNFHLRSRVEYGQPDNAIVSLIVQKKVEGEWQDFVLNTLTPGFEIFVYAMFTCQHTYFRVNCAEQGLKLVRAEGDISLGTDADWNLERIDVSLRASLAEGQASTETIDYIVGRMGQCPVSRNTREVEATRIEISFDL